MAKRSPVLTLARGGIVAGKLSAARSRRLAFALAVFALIAVVLVVRGWPESRPARAAGNSDVVVDSGSFGDYSSIVLDASGNPVVSYYDAANNDVKVLHCGNADCSSGNSIVVADSTATLFSGTPNLRLDPTGHPVVAYFDFSTNLLNVLHCGDADCTAGNSITTPDVANSGRLPSLAVDSTGRPVLSYMGADNHLKVLHCGNITCTAGNTIATPDPFSIQRASALVLDAAGNPIVAYMDGTYNTLKVLSCGNPACLAGNTITLVDNKTRLYGYIALALDPAGSPVVNYTDTNTNKLTLLHCGNPTCTSGNSITVLNALGYSDFAAPYAALAIDAAGNPVIGWSPGVVILHCGNPSCVSGNTYADLSNDGRFPALVLDASGFPVISVVDGGLRVLHCGNPTCKAPLSTPAPTNTATGTPLPTASPRRPDFSIGIDTNGDAADDCRTNGQLPTKCTMTLGSTFQIHAYLDSFTGLSSYDNFDLFLTYFGVTSHDDASNAAWPDCGYPAAFYKASVVYWGCALGVGAPASSYTGLIGTTDFTCAASGGIVMTHGEDQTRLGEHDSETRLESNATESLTINCPATTPTSTPHPPPLGGVADYPNVSGGSSRWPSTALGFTIGLLAFGGMALYARRRRS